MAPAAGADPSHPNLRKEPDLKTARVGKPGVAFTCAVGSDDGAQGAGGDVRRHSRRLADQLRKGDRIYVDGGAHPEPRMGQQRSRLKVGGMEGRNARRDPGRNKPATGRRPRESNMFLKAWTMETPRGNGQMTGSVLRSPRG